MGNQSVISIPRPAFRKRYSADYRLLVLGNRAVDQHRDSEGFPAWETVHRPKGFYAGLSDKPILSNLSGCSEGIYDLAICCGISGEAYRFSLKREPAIAFPGVEVEVI